MQQLSVDGDLRRAEREKNEIVRAQRKYEEDLSRAKAMVREQQNKLGQTERKITFLETEAMRVKKLLSSIH